MLGYLDTTIANKMMENGLDEDKAVNQYGGIVNKDIPQTPDQQAQGQDSGEGKKGDNAGPGANIGGFATGASAPTADDIGLAATQLNSTTNQGYTQAQELAAKGQMRPQESESPGGGDLSGLVQAGMDRGASPGTSPTGSFSGGSGVGLGGIGGLDGQNGFDTSSWWQGGNQSQGGEQATEEAKTREETQASTGETTGVGQSEAGGAGMNPDAGSAGDVQKEDTYRGEGGLTGVSEPTDNAAAGDVTPSGLAGTSDVAEKGREAAQGSMDEYFFDKTGMTPEQRALWDRYMGDQSMSTQEKAARQAAVEEAYRRMEERVNRMAGATGGKSAREIIGANLAEFQRGQALGDIEGDIYSRKMQEMAAAGGLAEGAAGRLERQGEKGTAEEWKQKEFERSQQWREEDRQTAYDRAAKTFGEANLILGADGKVYTQDGKEVTEAIKSFPHLRKAYEEYLYNTGAATPKSSSKYESEQSYLEDDSQGWTRPWGESEKQAYANADEATKKKMERAHKAPWSAPKGSNVSDEAYYEQNMGGLGFSEEFVQATKGDPVKRKKALQMLATALWTPEEIEKYYDQYQG